MALVWHASRVWPHQANIEILFPQSSPNRRDPAAKDTLGDLAEATDGRTDGSAAWRVGPAARGAAISLLRLGDVEKSHVAFQIQDDPESLTQFVHRCRDRGVRAQELVNSLHKATDVHSRFALLLALGDYPWRKSTRPNVTELIRELTEAYRSDPSSAIHGATGWLLRKWGFGRK